MSALVAWIGALAALSFTPSQMLGWSPQAFKDHNPTVYQLDPQDDEPLLRAECKASASGLVRRVRVDLRITPVLRWTWRAGDVYPGTNERTRAGDDYPARVYVVKSGGLLRWRSRAINYVWSSYQPVGSSWANAYAPEQVRMVAVTSGPPIGRKLERVTRNVMDDFRELFGAEVTGIDAVALMTDCDDTGGQARAWYGAIDFLPLE